MAGWTMPRSVSPHPTLPSRRARTCTFLFVVLGSIPVLLQRFCAFPALTKGGHRRKFCFKPRPTQQTTDSDSLLFPHSQLGYVEVKEYRVSNFKKTPKVKEHKLEREVKDTVLRLDPVDWGPAFADSIKCYQQAGVVIAPGDAILEETRQLTCNTVHLYVVTSCLAGGKSLYDYEFQYDEQAPLRVSKLKYDTAEHIELRRANATKGQQERKGRVSVVWV